MGRTAFTKYELKRIETILAELRRSDRSRQKVLRAKLRQQFGFYISDFTTDQQGYTASDLDELVRRGAIAVIDDVAIAEPGDSAKISAPPQERALISVEEPTDGVTAPHLQSFERADLEAVKAG